MTILGIDVGSSSVKAAILRNGKIQGDCVRAGFPTRYDGPRVEVAPNAVMKAITTALKQIGPRIKQVDLIGFTAMAPSWVAMDRTGKALTPIITHQDRRSVAVAMELEDRVGKAHHLALAGNRPFPGGISSTTFRWYLNNEPALIGRADLVGHLNTFLHRQLTGSRVIDPSNASFTGLYLTLTQGGWSEELCDAVGVSKSLLPDVLEANQIGGTIHAAAARRMGLTQGTPLTVGCMDTSAALLLTGMKVGQMLNVSGSTDVLAVCTDTPKPHERLLTRAVGVGRRWMSVSTLAAAGSSLTWAHQQLFSDLDVPGFRKLIRTLVRKQMKSDVRFEPYLAGERTSVEQKQGGFTGLTLATTRQEMLHAVIESLARVSAARIPLLAGQGTKLRHNVFVSGGVQGGLDKVLHRDWPGKWTFHVEEEATLRGLALLVP